jgi:uncharacterized XkdX family phage protein
MNWFNTVKDFYDSRLYTKEDVKVFVANSKITEIEYQQITGEAYTV